MGNVRIKLKRRGVRALLRSEEMKSICEDVAGGVLDRCGSGYAMDAHVGKTRVNAMVYVDSPKASRDNLKNNTLAKAVGR